MNSIHCTVYNEIKIIRTIKKCAHTVYSYVQHEQCTPFECPVVKNLRVASSYHHFIYSTLKLMAYCRASAIQIVQRATRVLTGLGLDIRLLLNSLT